jgi:hypothetical protein
MGRKSRYKARRGMLRDIPTTRREKTACGLLALNVKLVSPLARHTGQLVGALEG